MQTLAGHGAGAAPEAPRTAEKRDSQGSRDSVDTAGTFTVPTGPGHGHSREHILAHVRRINAALIAWDQYVANCALPEDLRRPLEAPAVEAAVLRGLRRTLLRQLKPPAELTA